MKYAALFALFVSSAACANGLDELKAALAPLQGQGALRGVYEARESKTDLQAKPAKPPVAVNASAQVEEDGTALAIRWDRALLKRAADEASLAKGAQRKEALSSLITFSSAPRISTALNYAPRLLQMLSTSQFKSERPDVFQGKPARLLEVTMTPQEPENASVSIKENTIAAQIWLDASGMPLGAVTSQVIKAKFMVFMSYDKTIREELAFTVAGNRLVVLRRDSKGKEKGPGSDNEFHNLYTFTPKA